MSEPYTFDVRVTPEHSHTALKRFLIREAGVSTVVLLFMLALYVAYEFKTKGALGWLSTLLLAVMVLFGVLMSVALLIRRHQANVLHARLGDATIAYRLDEDMIGGESPLGTWSFKWAFLRRLTIDSDLVMAFYARNAYITIPTDQIPDEAFAFMLEKIETAGGKIEDRRT